VRLLAFQVREALLEPVDHIVLDAGRRRLSEDVDRFSRIARCIISRRGSAIGRARPWTPLKPYAVVYPGMRDEQPMPETSAISCGGRPIAASAR